MGDENDKIGLYASTDRRAGDNESFYIFLIKIIPQAT
jgi:hypothetical protein